MGLSVHVFVCLVSVYVCSIYFCPVCVCESFFILQFCSCLILRSFLQLSAEYFFLHGRIVPEREQWKRVLVCVSCVVSYRQPCFSRTRHTRSRRPLRCLGRASPRLPIHHPDPIPISTIPTWRSILFYYYRLPGEGCSRRGPVHPFAPYLGGPTATTVAPPIAVAVRSDSEDPPASGHPSCLVSARDRDRAYRCCVYCYYCWLRSPHRIYVPYCPVPVDPVCPDCHPVPFRHHRLPQFLLHHHNPRVRSSVRSVDRRR